MRLLNNKKIVFFTAGDESTGSTRIRILSLIDELKHRGYKVYFNENFEKADIVVFQKSDYHYLKKYFYKSLFSNKFIIFDIDDLYTDFHLRFVKYADLVITSCEYMKNEYLCLNKNIDVLAGTPDLIDYSLPIASYDLSRMNVGWFGTWYNKTLIDKFNIKNVKTITKGGDIEWNKETVDKDIQSFDLIVIPQEKTKEGLSKDNCRMLKALYLGVPVLVSDIPDYVELSNLVGYPNEFIVKDGEDWNKKIEDIKIGKIRFDFDFVKCRKILNVHFSKESMTNKWLSFLFNRYKRFPIINHFLLLIKNYKDIRKMRK